MNNIVTAKGIYSYRQSLRLILGLSPNQTLTEFDSNTKDLRYELKSKHSQCDTVRTTISILSNPK